METNPFRAQRRAAESTGGGDTSADADGTEAHGRGGTPERGGTPKPGSTGGGTSRTGLRGWVAERVAGQRWWVRAPLLVVFAWMLDGFLRDPMYATIFDGINLGIHEAGHAAFSWLGSRILTTAGGTIFQLAIPLVAGVYLAVKQRDPFGATVCLFWLGTSLVNAGVYAADARAQALPLVSPFGPVDVDSHDWTVMLMKYGMLTRDQAIGALLRRAGLAAMIASLVTGAWVLRVMAVETRRAGDRPAHGP